ncbi:MAG: hypothetical protein KGL39_14575 [Patescibacteria group bacterium]|nr:hypothetical protein [Patescibacteria group bacterium]
MTNEKHELVKALAVALNCHSAENGSDMPDFILAKFLADVLAAFDAATAMREAWYCRAKESPPTHAAADQPGAAPSQEGAGSATAAPAGERTCVWKEHTTANGIIVDPHQDCVWTQALMAYCPTCGGKIIVEAT